MRRFHRITSQRRGRRTLHERRPQTGEQCALVVHSAIQTLKRKMHLKSVTVNPALWGHSVLQWKMTINNEWPYKAGLRQTDRHYNRPIRIPMLANMNNIRHIK